MRATCPPQKQRASARRPRVTPSRWSAPTAPTPTASDAQQIGLPEINDPFGDVSPSGTGWAIRPHDPPRHILLSDGHATAGGMEGHLASPERRLPKEEGQCGRGARWRSCSR